MNTRCKGCIAWETVAGRRAADLQFARAVNVLLIGAVAVLGVAIIIMATVRS